MTEKPQVPLLKQAALQIISGGSAGFVEVCIMHPLDLVKTRLQIQNKKTITTSVSGKSQVTFSYRFFVVVSIDPYVLNIPSYTYSHLFTDLLQWRVRLF